MQIVRNELSAPRIEWLDEKDRWLTLKKVWEEIVLLTGAMVFPDGELLDNQFGMLEVLIMSNPKFSRLTLHEIRHAFYLNAQGEFADSAPSSSGGMFRHYRNELNGEFVGDVLNAYVRKKLKLYDTKLYGILRTMRLPATVEIPIITDDDWRRMIQQDHERILNDEPYMIFNSSPKYVFLRKAGLIKFSNKEKWFEWYQRALKIREAKARRMPASKFSDRVARENAISMYQAIYRKGIIPVQEHRSVLHEMRHMAYLKFLEISVSRGGIPYFIPKHD